MNSGAEAKTSPRTNKHNQSLLIALIHNLLYYINKKLPKLAFQTNWYGTDMENSGHFGPLKIRHVLRVQKLGYAYLEKIFELQVEVFDFED